MVISRKQLVLVPLLIFSLLNGTPPFTCNMAEFNHQFFTCIYKMNGWGSAESASGPGSTLAETEVIRTQLPIILQELGVKVLLDAACGDFNWVQHVNLDFLDMYIGIDIVYDMISSNIRKYGNHPKRLFMRKDIIVDQLPTADAVMCRDCLSHLNFDDIWKIFANFKRNGTTKWIIITTYPSRTINQDLPLTALFNLLRYRPLNFQAAPFNFKSPRYVFNEKSTENGIGDKSFAVWHVDDIVLPAHIKI